jgi:archaeal type IV pilus assembly protein PilA
MAFNKNEEAVSPVIGVILMVAITVILAAVIAAFVFGMAGNVQKTKVVASTVSQNGANIQITYQGGQDSAAVQYIKFAVPTNATATVGPWYSGAPNGGSTGASGATSAAVTTTQPAPPGPANVPAVGAVFILVDKGTSARDQVTVTAHFSDGSEQVIMDTTV